MANQENVAFGVEEYRVSITKSMIGGNTLRDSVHRQYKRCGKDWHDTNAFHGLALLVPLSFLFFSTWIGVGLLELPLVGTWALSVIIFTGIVVLFASIVISMVTLANMCIPGNQKKMRKAILGRIATFERANYIKEIIDDNIEKHGRLTTNDELRVTILSADTPFKFGYQELIVEAYRNGSPLNDWWFVITLPRRSLNELLLSLKSKPILIGEKKTM